MEEEEKLEDDIMAGDSGDSRQDTDFFKGLTDMPLETREHIQAEKIELNTKGSIKKLKTAAAIYIVASFLCIFYFGSYLLSRNVLNEFQGAFDKYRYINNRRPCISDSFFFLQLAILQNRSVSSNSLIG